MNFKKETKQFENLLKFQKEKICSVYIDQSYNKFSKI